MASSGSENDFEVDQILKQRKARGRVEYLVRWAGFGEEEDSWEPETNLGNCRDKLEVFKKQMATPARASARKSVASIKKETGRTTERMSKTTSTTSTYMEKYSSVSKTKGDSEFSSPESSPVLSRKAMTSSGDQQSVRTTRSTTTQQFASAKDTLAAIRQGNTTKAKTRGAPYLSLSAQDIPVIILLSCILFIALTFVIKT